jgi:hypothetical protein
MYGRLPFRRIDSRGKPGEFAEASIKDFTLSEPIEELQLRGAEVAAYSMDAATRSVLMTYIPERSVNDYRPFFYMRQFDLASHAALISADTFCDFASHSSNSHHPVFILSIGRCGSTLLSQSAKAVGTLSIPEPDILTVLASKRKSGSHTIPPKDWKRLYTSSISHLSAIADEKIVVFKFRAQSTTPFHAARLATLYPDARYIFVFRELKPWAASFVSTLRFSNKTLGWLLKSAIQALDTLTNAGIVPTIIWYEDFSTDLTTPAQAMVNRTLAVDEREKLRIVLNTDPQEGTRLSVNRARKANLMEIDDFLQYWKSIRPAELIEKYKFPY